MASFCSFNIRTVHVSASTIAEKKVPFANAINLVSIFISIDKDYIPFVQVYSTFRQQVRKSEQTCWPLYSPQKYAGIQIKVK